MISEIIRSQPQISQIYRSDQRPRARGCDLIGSVNPVIISYVVRVISTSGYFEVKF